MGRREDSQRITGLLADHRMVTLTGPGGIGKTRVAIELALSGALDGFGEVVWIDLSAIRDGAELDGALLAALDLSRGPEPSPLDLIVARLESRSAILLIDNCEHIVHEIAPRLLRILMGCALVRVLATSRIPLGIDGEAICVLPGLSLPDDDRPGHGDAVALFKSRARSATGGRAIPRAELVTVDAICRALEGVPLAIELAAGQMRTASTNEVHDRLAVQLDVLVGGSALKPTRYRSLRDSIDWSYELLGQRERILLRRLSVFAGGWDADAMRVVCAGDRLLGDEPIAILDQLVLKSVVQADRPGRRTRYSLLEPIREYARERLRESGEEPVLEDRHAHWFLALACQADSQYWALDPRRRVVLDREAGNFAAALDHACRTGSPAALELAGHLCTYWRELGAFEHAAAAIDRTLREGPSEPSESRAFALMWGGCLRFHRGDFVEAMKLLEESERMLERVPSRRTEAWLAGLRATITSVVDPAAGDEALDRACALAREAGDQLLASYLLVPALIACDCRDDYEGVHRTATRATAVAREIGHQLPDRWVAWCLARQALLRGELEQCQAQLATARNLSTHRDAEASCSTAALASLAATYAGRLDVARELAGHAHDLARGGTYWTGAGNVGVAMGFLALAEGDQEGATHWAQQLVAREGGGAHIPVHGEELLMMAALSAPDNAAVRDRADALAGLAQRFANRRAAALAHYARSVAALVTGSQVIAAASARAALEMQLAGSWRPGAIDSLELLSATERASGRSEQATVLLAAAGRARSELGIPRLVPPLPQLTSLEARTSDAADHRTAAARAFGACLSLADALAYARSRSSRNAPRAAAFAGLTPAEQVVADLAADGLSNPAIAERLVISRATVKTHLSHIFSKVGVKNRTELAIAIRTSRPRQNNDRD